MEYLVPTDLARPLLLSLRVAGIATALSFLAALFVAWRLARRRGPLPALLDALCTLPLVLPPTVLGYYLILVVGRNGLLGPAGALAACCAVTAAGCIGLLHLLRRWGTAAFARL